MSGNVRLHKAGAGSAAVFASNSNGLSFTVAGAPIALPSPPVAEAMVAPAFSRVVL